MREGEISCVWLVLEAGWHDLMTSAYYAFDTCPSCGSPKCPRRSLLGAEPASLAVTVSETTGLVFRSRPKGGRLRSGHELLDQTERAVLG